MSKYSDQIQIEFSPKLKRLLRTLEEKYSNYVAYELNDMATGDVPYDNVLNISSIDISKVDFSFDITIDDKIQHIKIGNFLRTYYPGIFSDNDIRVFSNSVVNLNKGTTPKGVKGTPIEHKPFEFSPKDPRSTFLSLVTKTYPMGHETEVLEFLPKLEQDPFGNYFKVISGDDTTMFTSHLDTADMVQKPTKLLSKVVDGDEYIFTDGSSILGADDKAGITVMLYMMAHNIPGIYYFFVGEERGGIGSGDLAREYDSFDFLANVTKCISFDRRKTGSIITSQYGRVCCSNDFGSALAREYNKGGLNLSVDPTGVFTDSASLMDDIAECTNVSVGYNNEHTTDEIQNMTYLIKLCEASLNVNWKELPITRKVGFDQELLKKYRHVIEDIREVTFYLDVKFSGYGDRIFIKVDTSNGDINEIYDTLATLQSILYKNRVDPYVVFEDSEIKIELR